MQSIDRKQTSVYLDPAIRKRLLLAAAEMDVSITAVVQASVIQFLDSNQKIVKKAG